MRLSREGLGLDPGALTFGGLVLPPPPGSQFDTQDLKANQLNYHGFLRAPLRVGIGSGDYVEPGVATGAKLHSPPIIVDGSYTNWTYTGDNGGPWTEMRLSWGNAKVFGNVSIASYNLTDAGYKDLVAQLGIDQAWVTINQPDFFGDRGGFLLNVGGFGGGYGSAGRYDAGAYGTYVFGRTHTTGYAISAFYDITDEITLQGEQGFGARLDVTPFDPAAPMAQWLPYPGPVEQFPTMLHHAHIGATYLDHYRVALHYLTGWTQAATRAGERDGRITSYGAEFKMIDTQFGHAFLGLGRINAKEALRVAGVLEAIHSWEGWSLAENYFGAASQGNGNITTLAWEWTFSLATFLRYPESFWGQGPDLVFRTFGMYNRVDGDGDPTFSGATAKLKLGGSLTYTPLSWLGTSVPLRHRPAEHERLARVVPGDLPAAPVPHRLHQPRGDRADVQPLHPRLEREAELPVRRADDDQPGHPPGRERHLADRHHVVVAARRQDDGWLERLRRSSQRAV